MLPSRVFPVFAERFRDSDLALLHSPHLSDGDASLEDTVEITGWNDPRLWLSVPFV